MKAPPRWNQDEIRIGLELAVAAFRIERMQEPLDFYLDRFDDYQGRVEELFETTVDLTELDETALGVLTDERLLEAFRYLAGPPISTDDLKTVADVNSLAASRLRDDPNMVRRIVEVVLQGLDRRRFPWMENGGREPTETEKRAAVVASAALMAASRASTTRRNTTKAEQEAKVGACLVGIGLTRVPTRNVPNLVAAPALGEFCGESYLGPHKADFIVRLWDSRVMPIECKVSNSSVNSVKRLNEAKSKAKDWLHDFGATQVVPTAVLSGVYKLHNLEEAQERNLSLFWAHDVTSLAEWIIATRG
jgi:hypothetical protein